MTHSNTKTHQGPAGPICISCNNRGYMLTAPQMGEGRIDACANCALQAEAEWRFGQNANHRKVSA